MMVWFSILLYFVSIQLDNFVCCPVGYDSCNLQDSGNCPPDPTTQNHGEVAFGTDSDGIWTYKSLSTTTLQRDCTVTEFGDPSPGNAKECCITNLSDITIAANIVGEMSCGDTTKVWFKDEINRRHWKLTTTQSNDITYYGCNTGFDSTTTVYNSSLAVISNTQCSPNIDGFGNNCGLCAAEEFTLTNQEAGVYWIRLGYFSDASAPGNKIYELTITCNPNTVSPTTVSPTTNVPTTSDPTTALPTTAIPTTNVPTTTNPTTGAPTSAIPTTINPTTYTPSSAAPTTWNPTTTNPTTDTPTTFNPTYYPSIYPSINPSGFPSSAPTYGGGRGVHETTQNPDVTESEDTLRDNNNGFDYLTVIIYVLVVLIGLCCIGAVICIGCFIRKSRNKNEQAKIDKNLENGPEYILETSPTITAVTNNGTGGQSSGIGETFDEVQLHNHDIEMERVQSNEDENMNDTDEDEMNEMYTENITKGGENVYQQDANENILDENENEQDLGSLYGKGGGKHVTAGDENNFDSTQTAGCQN